MATSQQGILTVHNRQPWCRAERLFMLKCMFVEGGSYTIAELTERFNVSEQTIGSDLRLLSSKLGVPLVCEARWHIMAKG